MRASPAWLLVSSFLISCSSSEEGTPSADASTGDPDTAIEEASVDTGTPIVDAPATVDATIDCAPDAGRTNELACTGLYSDWGMRTIAAGVREYKPGFELWSDGAIKRRWVYLPPGTKIDVTNLDEWVFPVGTKFWKEFVVVVGGVKRPVETRFLEKTSATEWRRTTFFWSADGTSAPELTTGAPLIAGSNKYSVPPVTLCAKCHGGRADNVLGLETVLSAAPEATGLTWSTMQALGALTSTNGNHTLAASALQIPGNSTERPAVALLHVNCGVACHNANVATQFDARLEFGATGKTTPTLFSTSLYATTINKRSTFRPKTAGSELYYRVRPGDVAHSTIAYRMGVRDIDTDGGVTEQMPQVATNLVDDDGVAVIKKWIGEMGPDGGYPDPATLDAGVVDSAKPDTSVTDTAVADTTVIDTAVADTSVADTKVTETGTCALPPLKLTLMPGSFTQPVFVSSPPGDTTRLFVVEKGGTIRIIKSGTALATPFLTVSDWYVPSATSEGGLLGLAFHPNYASNGRFFLHYTSSPSGHVVVREFKRSTSNPDLADVAPVKTLLDKAHGGWNHVGGTLAFDKAGLLYASVGDAAMMPSPARDLTTHLGKILRFDVDSTTAPAGNVTGTGVFPYIWDYGFRNPWRFSFDRLTGDLYAGDVGQATWEEIDVEPAGTGKRDYGWPVMEGAHCFPAGSTCTSVGVLPTVEHPRTEASSIVGGYVYRGSKIPCLNGRYVYGDYGTGHIFSFVWNGSTATSKIDLSTDLNPSGSLAASIVSFGEDSAGELYLVNLFPGRVYRIDPE